MVPAGRRDGDPEPGGTRDPGIHRSCGAEAPRVASGSVRPSPNLFTVFAGFLGAVVLAGLAVIVSPRYWGSDRQGDLLLVTLLPRTPWPAEELATAGGAAWVLVAVALLGTVACVPRFRRAGILFAIGRIVLLLSFVLAGLSLFACRGLDLGDGPLFFDGTEMGFHAQAALARLRIGAVLFLPLLTVADVLHRLRRKTSPRPPTLGGLLAPFVLLAGIFAAASLALSTSGAPTVDEKLLATLGTAALLIALVAVSAAVLTAGFPRTPPPVRARAKEAERYGSPLGLLTPLAIGGLLVWFLVWRTGVVERIGDQVAGRAPASVILLVSAPLTALFVLAAIWTGLTVTAAPARRAQKRWLGWLPGTVSVYCLAVLGVTILLGLIGIAYSVRLTNRFGWGTQPRDHVELYAFFSWTRIAVLVGAGGLVLPAILRRQAERVVIAPAPERAFPPGKWRERWPPGRKRRGSRSS